MTEPHPLPNFFLAGVPKSGSTSLNRYLEQHPDIYMSPVKEPHYFADEIRFENFSPEFQRLAAQTQRTLREFLAGPMTGRCSAGPVEAWDDYVRLFANVRNERAAGEASVCYLWSPTAARNIVARLPDAKFLIVLRNPVDRAFSQYKHMLSFARRHVTFREHFQAYRASQSTKFSELYPFLEFGFYGEQVERLFTMVPRERVGIWFYEDFCRDAAGMLREIFAFLGVDDRFVPDFAERHMEPRIPRSYEAHRFLRGTGLWRAARAVLPATARARLRSAVFASNRQIVLDSTERGLLEDFYRDDVQKLSALLNRDLTHWLRPPS
jgi:hypothetical protein